MTSKQPEHTVQTTKVELPKWVDKASLENYRLAKQIGTRPYKAYKGDTVADMDPMINDAFSYLSSSNAANTANYGSATDIFKQIANANITPGQVTMGQLKDADLQAYMNPYIDNVESKSLAALNDSRIQALMGNSDAAAAAGAFGGSRHGIVDAVTNSETAKNAGLLSAQLRSDAFNNAQDAAYKDITGKYTSDVGNRDADYNAQLARLEAMQSGAQGILSSTDSKQAADMQQFAGLLQGGSLKQAQQQKELDALKAKWDDKQNYGAEKLNLRLSALGMSPYGKTESTDKTVDPASSGTDWAQAGMGIFSLLMGLSDDDTKTDKERVGKLPGTDLDLYAYRYKKDPKTYPKVVGIMASDVAEKIPGAVKEIDGRRIVDYSKILETI